MATDEDYPIDLPILVIEAQIFVAVKKLPFLPNKLIPIVLVTKIFDGTELDNDGESREAVVVGKYFEEISRPNTPIGQKS